MTDQDEQLAIIRSAARNYFRDREAWEASKAILLESIFDGAEDFKLTQQEMADVCDLTDEQPEADASPFAEPQREWRFHRTRVQQFLDTARIKARRAAA